MSTAPWPTLVFSEWEEHIEYWWVEDLRQAPADEALAEIDRRIESLLAHLKELSL